MTEGIRTLRSPHSVDETVTRLQTLLIQKGVKLFALIDHIMVAAPTAALDLPLKILVAESATGEVLVSWNDPAWLQQRHDFPSDLAANLAAAELLAKAATAN
jgi:uncharacterized protein (DUF302 family)